jgi:hypothetical protein
MLAFDIFIAIHITAGSVGLLSFWVPVVSRKGGRDHRRWGRVFTWCMLVTGCAAIGISFCTLVAPLETHPQLSDAAWIRGIFGWMMLGLAILTINLAWYGWLCVLNRNDHRRNLEWRNLLLQYLLIAASANCAWQGLRIGQPLMFGMPAIGFATAFTNLYFLYKPRRGPNDWLLEHIKALVGAGISVYTAFFAFGAVRTIPALALHPALWAIPLTVGLALILYHQRNVRRSTSARRGLSRATT